MKNVSAKLTVALLILCLPGLAYSQEAKAPVYKDGEWWKVRIERKKEPTITRCFTEYSTYLVKIQNGKPKVFSVSGANEEEFDCPSIEGQVLGIGRRNVPRLKFPLRIGKRWNKHFRRGRTWFPSKYEVLGWEKVQTPKGEFEAFKLSRNYEVTTRAGDRLKTSETYYYSPKAKAIILLKIKSPRNELTNTLIDFNVSN